MRNTAFFPANSVVSWDKRHTGMEISYWEKSSFYAEKDIIIVGAGLQGLWSAYELKKQKPALNILIVERGPVPHGASTRNAGFSCFGSPTELLHNANLNGEDRMLFGVENLFKGIQKIQRIFPSSVIDYTPCGGYECLDNNLHDVANIYDQLAWLNKQTRSITGTERTFIQADHKLQQLGLQNFDGLVENTLEGALHSGKLLQALTQLVQQMGVEILTGVEIVHVEPGATVELHTARGITFKAGSVLFCINAFTGTFFPQLHIKPGRGQVLISSPIEGLALNGTFHYDEGFYYFRNVGNRILLGGARNKAFEEETVTTLTTSTTIQSALEAFLSKHFITPSPITIEQRWSGIMGFTPNKLPVLEQVYDNVWSVVACNGMGVALTPIMAEEVAGVMMA